MTANPIHPDQAPPRHVLVVDDNRATADSTTELLSLCPGWIADVAYDGGDCLRQACARRPDVVLLDLRMPVMGGLEVARRIRAQYPGNAPYLIAVTGCAEEVEDLAAMDQVFDRVLAKPLDIEELLSSLQRLARNGQPVEPSAKAFVDVAEVFTRAARKVAPLAAARGLDLSYDHVGDSVLVLDDAVQLHRAFDPMWLSLLDVVRGGSILLRTRADLRPSGTATLTVDAAATGPFVDSGRIAIWLDGLGLRHDAASASASEGTGATPSPLRQGRCARTGAQLSCWLDAKEGLLLRATLHYPQATRNEAVGRPLVRDAHAWLVARHVLPMAAETLRLRRLGWAVTPMDSCTQAKAALADAHTPSSSAPDLLVVFGEDGLALADVLPLARAMPATTRCLMALTSGHAWLGAPDELPGFELCTSPFSPLDLAGLCKPHLSDTADAADAADAGEPAAAAGWAQDTLQAGLTRPTDPGLDDRPRVLVVDDSDVNRLVGRSLVEILGYAADSAHDGLDAIDSCRRRPPACVLMDVDMPVLGGIDATARLRELQRAGELPLFPVIAATANGDYEAACLAVGMDGFLVKPLDLRQLRAMLRRFTDGVVVR